MSSFPESGVPRGGGIDFTRLQELCIVTKSAKREDIGAMAHVFLDSFPDDKTARLLYPRDRVWPVVVEMLRTYLEEEKKNALDDDDYYRFCDSTVWAGLDLLRKESQLRPRGPLQVDEMRRAALITELGKRNRDGQKRSNLGQHLVINTIAINPDVVEKEEPEIAYKLMDDARDLARRNRLPLWGQFPEYALGDLEGLFREIGFDEVGSFELNLNRYANEHQRREDWGSQKWSQWLLRTGNWEQGRRY